MKYGVMVRVYDHGKILMIGRTLRKKGQNSLIYTFPGGERKNSRGKYDSIIRLTREQTGLTIEPLLVGEIFFKNFRGLFDNSRTLEDYCVSMFTAGRPDEVELKGKREGRTPRWVEEHDVELSAFPGYDEINRWIKHPNFPAGNITICGKELGKRVDSHSIS
jgi:8-oxo-dGTP pyrophosphatase MutT (NUDIX family)